MCFRTGSGQDGLAPIPVFSVMLACCGAVSRRRKKYRKARRADTYPGVWRITLSSDFLRRARRTAPPGVQAQHGDGVWLALAAQVVQHGGGVALEDRAAGFLLALVGVHGVVVLDQQAADPVAVSVNHAAAPLLGQGGVHDGGQLLVALAAQAL